jgi:hypothetical protein
MREALRSVDWLLVFIIAYASLIVFTIVMGFLEITHKNDIRSRISKGETELCSEYAGVKMKLVPVDCVKYFINK